MVFSEKQSQIVDEPSTLKRGPSFYSEAVMGKVNEWLYICSKCGHHVTDGVTVYGECPDCHASSWLCHLRSQDDSKGKISGNEALAPVITPPVILSQENEPLHNWDKITLSKSQAGKSRLGRKQHPIPGDLIKQLASQGHSSRQIAEKLSEHGTNTSYKTVQRVLSGQRQGSLL